MKKLIKKPIGNREIMRNYFSTIGLVNPEKRNVPLYKNDAFQKVQKRRKKRLYRRSKAVSALSGTLYQVRLGNHHTFRVFYGPIGQTGM